MKCALSSVTYFLMMIINHYGRDENRLSRLIALPKTRCADGRRSIPLYAARFSLSVSLENRRTI